MSHSNNNPSCANDPEEDGGEGGPVHQGKWTPEEEEYVQGLIDEFKAGLLPLAEGTSLRTFLSKMLNCQPMRISKKFVGTNYNGKQVYVRRKNKMSNDEVRERRVKLQELERKFLAKAQQIEGGAAAAAAAAGASPMTAGKPAVESSSQAAMLSALAAAGGGGGGSMSALDAAAMEALFGSGTSASGLDVESQLGGASRNPAAAAGRALLGGDFKPAAVSAGGDSADSATAGLGGGGLAGFSSAELAAELRKRVGMEGLLGSTKRSTSIENLLAGGVASELQNRASVENLVANSNLLNAARNSFHRTSANNLLTAAQFRTSSASNLLNAARNSFHKNSTSNLLNAAAGSFARQGSASNNLLNASFRPKLSSSNLLNAAVSARNLSSSNLLNAAVSARQLSSSGLLNAAASARTLSSSNLLNAARATNANMTALQSMLAAREGASGDTDNRPLGSSLSDMIARNNSSDFQRKMSGLMENIQQQAGSGGNKNWSASSSGGGLRTSSGSRSNLINLRLSMQNELHESGGGGASLLNNAAFAAVAAGSDGASRLELAKLLSEQGFHGDSTSSVLAQLQQSNDPVGDAASLDKEALLQQLRGAGGGGGGSSSAIEEYLLSQERLRAAAQASEGGQGSGGDSANEAELAAMMNLKRKFLQDGESLEEQLAKRMR